MKSVGTRPHDIQKASQQKLEEISTIGGMV